MPKYGNRKTTVGQRTFDSAKEARRYQQLCLAEKAGAIRNLQMQVRRELIPAQYINGRCAERAVTYTSDFEYDTDSGHTVEDVKGMRTKEYVIKRKLMLYIHGIRITEI